MEPTQAAEAIKQTYLRFMSGFLPFARAGHSIGCYAHILAMAKQAILIMPRATNCIPWPWQ
jgi:hypothetical protein